MIAKKNFVNITPLTKEHFITKLSKQNQFSDKYQYFPSDKLGQGSSSTVYKVYHKRTGIVRALKKINLTTNTKNFVKETSLLKELDHPNISRLYDYYEEDGQLYLVLEYYKGNDLFDKLIELGTFNEDHAQELFIQLIRAINYFHQRFIVHRDLKPENFLFFKKHSLKDICLIDFGSANKCNKGQVLNLESKFGLIYNKSPEMLNQQYTHESDIWSAGVFLYIMLQGYPPYYADNDQETEKLIRLNQLDFKSEEFQTISQNCKDLIQKMLTPLETRISIPNIFKHIWIQQGLKLERQKYENLIDQVVNLEKFILWEQYPYLKRLALLFLATQVNLNQIETIKTVFLLINTSQTGRISLQEIQGVLKDNSQKLMDLFRLADANEDNTLGFFGNYFQLATLHQNLRVYVQKFKSI